MRKMNSDTFEKYLVILFFLTFFILFMIWVKNDNKKLIDSIRKNECYSIGTVTNIVGGHGGFYGSYFNVSPSAPLINISFYFKGKLIKTNAKSFYDSNKENIGKRFVVAFDSTNTENCIMLFDYPVKDDSDFFRYLEEFRSCLPKLESVK